MKSFVPVSKRCRPLLGTFVEISFITAPDFSSSFTLFFSSPEFLEQVFQLAFVEIEMVSSLMSFHSPLSELSRLNSQPVSKWMEISEAFQEVLTLALELQKHTEGLFNVAVGKPLVEWGFLPEHSFAPNSKDLLPGVAPGFEVRGSRARRLLDVKIDLGGIAKGYAVDRAVALIQKHAPSLSGCVNAGGDLRIFGDYPQTVKVRSHSMRAMNSFQLRNGAVATSTVCLVESKSKTVSAYLNPQSGLAVLKKHTAVAHAKSCAVADAFTKIALLTSRKKLTELSLQYHVQAQVIS
jgi:thiamine biosynthesis lipoprotein